jgi:hypothetical protein
MPLPTAPFYPSTLLDPRNAADLKQLLWQNFFIINEGPGFSRQPTRIGGQPNTEVGPPTFGQHYVNAVWVDGIRGLWYCIASGIPGTWIQAELPVVTSFPTTTYVGYRVTRSDQGYASYYWDGTAWVPISGASPSGVTGAQNMGTAADGEGLYDSLYGSILLFRRIKAGENINLVSNANSVEVLVQHDPHFIGTTTVDILKIIAQAAPATPADDSFVSWVSSSGTSPNKTLIWKAKSRDGTEVILSSVIV